MPNISPSHEPAVWIGLLGAIAAAIVNSGAIPALTANAATANVLIAAIVGVLIRFFVTPNAKIIAPPTPTKP